MILLLGVPLLYAILQVLWPSLFKVYMPAFFPHGLRLAVCKQPTLHIVLLKTSLLLTLKKNVQQGGVFIHVFTCIRTICMRWHKITICTIGSRDTAGGHAGPRNHHWKHISLRGIKSAAIRDRGDRWKTCFMWLFEGGLPWLWTLYEPILGWQRT